jgi:hypothetical protein
MFKTLKTEIPKTAAGRQPDADPWHVLMRHRHDILKCALQLGLGGSGQPLGRERQLKAARDDEAVDVRLARLPDAVHTPHHLLLDGDVGLRLHDDHVRRRRQREPRRITLR